MYKSITLLYLAFLSLIYAKEPLNEGQEINITEIKEGQRLDVDKWENDKPYEYYLNIDKYNLNEENVLEIWENNTKIETSLMTIYISLVNVSESQIKNDSIKFNETDKYEITSKNIFIDSLKNETCYFIPFKITKKAHYLLISINNIGTKNDLYLYIPKINSIEAINQNEFSKTNIIERKNIEIKNNIRLYYKIGIQNINLEENNLFFLFDKNSEDLEIIFYEDFISLNPENYAYFIQKNKSDISSLYFSIKYKNDSKSELNINLKIREDNNTYYVIKNYERDLIKLYIENIKCDEKIFILEKYNNYNDKNRYFLIPEKLYGNYFLKLFDSIDNLNFEQNYDNGETIIPNQIFNLTDGLVNVYILECTTPSAFYFEIFMDKNCPKFIFPGETIKTFLPTNSYYYNYVSIKDLNDGAKYIINYKILNYSYPSEDSDTTLYTSFHTQGQDIDFELEKIENEDTQDYQELYKYEGDKYYTQFCFGALSDLFVEYFLSSNELFTNLEDGRTILMGNAQNYSLKIRKNFVYDYISINVESKYYIEGRYELKLVNSEYILSNLTLMVGAANVSMPYSDKINLKISNPADKFDQANKIYDENNEDIYNYFLLFTFNTSNVTPIYLDIDYIKNDDIINLPPNKSEIIIPQNEYEINIADNNYNEKDKLIINVNKCNKDMIYTLSNYYENEDNILRQTSINKNHQIIALNNRYNKTKMILKNESDLNETKGELNLNRANYCNKGDILLNYFLMNSIEYNQLIFADNLNIASTNSESKIKLNWPKYVYKLISNNEKVEIPTNYSIYILPEQSPVNTICQLYLIPANKSVVNKTETEIDINEEGKFKITLIARVIDNEAPFEIMYNMVIATYEKDKMIGLIVGICFGAVIIIALIWIFIFRKKLAYLCNKRRLSESIINTENEEVNKKKQLNEEFIKLINQSK